MKSQLRDRTPHFAGASIFDPVLCEIVYKWFCPQNGMVLDPFAGGSVRGIVASKLDRGYTGIELRQEQVDENIRQSQEIVPIFPPQWICGDSLEAIPSLPEDFEADLIFSCPPYGNIEKYSSLPQDLSNMSYADFRSAYRKIIELSCSRLKQNRFACFVVGEFRDRRSGVYANFISDTITAFTDAGLSYYNEAILITPPALLALRVSEGFQKSRKLGKTHQNVLVFVKGDPRLATEAIGEVEVGDIEEDDDLEEEGGVYEIN